MTDIAVAESTPLRKTPLYDLHLQHGAKMVGFAGYEMPVQYPLGVKKEHLHTRAAAGLFDVSHMGQVRLRADDPAATIERLVPGEIQQLKPGRMRYSVLTNEAGGIIDDLMITKMPDHLLLVVNAACKTQDIAHLSERLRGVAEIEPLPDLALLALQGPQAAAVLARSAPEVSALPFLAAAAASIDGIVCWVSRCGYTGEDGFEISCANRDASRVAAYLLGAPEVEPIGLGARDSLRLEAGLCLYGHDIDSTTTPIEADLAWVIGKRRREEGGFLGAKIILRQLAQGTVRKRVGIQPLDKAPAREDTAITDAAGRVIGRITSGTFGPSADRPIAMGYVETASSAIDTPVRLIVRDKPRAARVAATPFVPHRYYRG